MSSTWRYLASSVIGVSHEKEGSYCQDANQCLLIPSREGEILFVSVVADGAGSAKYGKEGATYICNHFRDRIDEFLVAHPFSELDRCHIVKWLEQYQYEVSLWAACCRIERAHFASTLLGAMIGESRAIFWQLGDGAIVIQRKEQPETYEYVFWPQQGEYANQTFFATQQEAKQLLQFQSYEEEIHEVALFTDGIQGIALQYDLQAAYAPFFRPFSQFLQRPDWNQKEGQKKLSAFLASKRINEHTNDDKTLVIASRYKEDRDGSSTANEE